MSGRQGKRHKVARGQQQGQKSERKIEFGFITVLSVERRERSTMHEWGVRDQHAKEPGDSES